ncbi:LysR substrate-binding domain-containing protein [Paraburkholderia rhizosphaerae]|uniref:LysR family hca operon transcriptional activator n=1 Tax=Paraburkholderia rhizosphaerae TaxID=480658 RepID=A0A4R8LKY1_9BURK|nr:LysR substrate-binding domain-containing protein [Paraburkholderia rhizosphaerae]TDY43309.1 LysR family hca operon transcriptional activator [Paraburkholderia rhizosphaerae]
MELRHLRYFIAVAETGSLTEAAEKRLHTSQPSLSRQIRDLEDQVGVELLVRSARGVELTDAGKAFIDHARLAIAQLDTAVEAARRAAQPAKPRFALGFLTGQEMTWLTDAMHLLREELPNIEVSVSSDYSTELAAALAHGKLDVAFMRAEPGYGLEYKVVGKEPLVVLMPSDHPLTARKTVRAEELRHEPFIAMADKAKALRQVIDAYLAKAGVEVDVAQSVDNPAMVMSLIASMRAVTLIPAYVQNLMPWSVVSRPLEGDVPTIELAVGYSPGNKAPIVSLFLSRVDELISRIAKRSA